MTYRHQQMIRAREERKAQVAERQKEVEALLRSCLTDEEHRIWRVFSDAVARVQPAVA
jgi:hypothetical protein